MRVTLNLASRPFADLAPALRRLRIAMAVLAVVCILVAVGLHLIGSEAQAARARDHSLDGQIASVQAERQQAAALMRQPANAQVLTQAEALNQLFDEKAFSWTLAMEAMETVLPSGVQVTSIEPIRAKDGHITVHLRVVGPRDRAVDLVSNLEHSRRFLQPRIVGENAESASNSNQRQEPISASNRFDFDLLADYNPPTPEERSAGAHAARAAEKGSDAPSPRTTPHHHSHPAPAAPAPHGRPPYVGSAPSAPSQPGSRPPSNPQGGPR